MDFEIEIQLHNYSETPLGNVRSADEGECQLNSDKMELTLTRQTSVVKLPVVRPSAWISGRGEMISRTERGHTCI